MIAMMDMLKAATVACTVNKSSNKSGLFDEKTILSIQTMCIHGIWEYKKVKATKANIKHKILISCLRVLFFIHHHHLILN